MELFPIEGAVEGAIAEGPVHLQLGIVNKLYDDLLVHFPEAKAWPEKLHLKPSEYFAGTWEGRQCRTLVANADVLQGIVDEENGPRRMLRSATDQNVTHVAQPFVDAFRAFSDVTSKCFGHSLKEGWEEAVSTFEEKYTLTG